MGGVSWIMGGTIMRGKLSHWSIEPDLYNEFESKCKELGLKRSQVIMDLIKLWINYIYPKLCNDGLSNSEDKK